jgi:hypothetical protein
MRRSPSVATGLGVSAMATASVIVVFMFFYIYISMQAFQVCHILSFDFFIPKTQIIVHAMKTRQKTQTFKQGL